MSGLRFCSECLNLLHPEEEIGIQRRLVFKCKSCKYQEPVSDPNSMQENKIYEREFKESVLETIIEPDYCLDPAMPREKKTCPYCGYNEAVYIIDRDPQDKCLRKIYVCGRNSGLKSICGRSFTSEYHDMEQMYGKIEVKKEKY